MESETSSRGATGGSFKERFCLAARCQPDRYEWRVLRRCRHRRSWLPYFLVKWLAPHLYADDLALIQLVAGSTNMADFRWTVQGHVDRYPVRGFWRRHLRLRMSRGHLLELAQVVFNQRSEVSLDTETWERGKRVVLG